MRFLIDGHNLIGKLPDLSLADPEDERKLVGRLHAYFQRVGKPVTVVFDPGAGYTSARGQPFPDVKVIYANRDSTADQVIVRMVRTERKPREVTVVTSDRQIIGQVRAEGAQVMSSEQFAREMEPPANDRGIDANEEEERANPRISKDEVSAWLDEFKRARQNAPARTPREKRNDHGK